MLRKPYQIGTLKLENNILYAPLAGCSDYPFRQMTSRYRPGLLFCEMVKMEPLVRDDPHTLRLLDYNPSMHPIGAQICGSKPQLAGAAAKRIESMGFDLIDLNCGCPVDKVTKDGSGSGLLRTPEKIEEILGEMLSAVKIPVTLKIRIGWDEDSLNAVEIAQIAERAGAASIAIHGRTREQSYTGAARWELIAACKRATSRIQVVGNGDLFTPESVERLFRETDCDGALIARGTMGTPWIIQEIIDHLEGRPFQTKTTKEQIEALTEHFACICAYQKEERQIVLDMRRVAPWYIKQIFGAAGWRAQFQRSRTIQEIEALLADLRQLT